MSDSDSSQNDEIEDLLKQAQAAASQASDAAAGSASGSEEASPTPAAASKSAAAKAVATATKTPASNRDATHDDINVLLQHAEQALASIDQPTAADLEGIAPFQFQDFASEPPSSEKATLELLRDVELDLKIELGRAYMQLEDILKLRKGSVVPLDKLAGDPVDVYVNGRLVARGEVLVLNDNFCVRVAQLLSGEEAA